MALFNRPSRSRLTLVLLVLTSLTVLTLDFRGAGIIGDVRGIAGTVFSPFEGAANAVTSPFSDAWNGITAYDELEAENAQLRDQLAELEGDEVRGQDAVRRLEEIEALEDIESTTGLDSVLTRVVAGPQTNFERSIVLDKGSDAGLSEGMPVVTGGGLVGRIDSTTSSRSVVRLITEPGERVAVLHGESGTIAFASGAGEGSPLLGVMPVTPGVELDEGDAFLTSGSTESIFPAGLPVAEVGAVRAAADQLTEEVDLVPLADLADLSYVRVLVWEPTP